MVYKLFVVVFVFASFTLQIQCLSLVQTNTSPSNSAGHSDSTVLSNVATAVEQTGSGNAASLGQIINKVIRAPLEIVQTNLNPEISNAVQSSKVLSNIAAVIEQNGNSNAASIGGQDSNATVEI